MLSTLPSRGIGFVAAQGNSDKKVQSRPDTPHKDLPNLQEVFDEGKGNRQTKAKDTPLKPAQQCRFRDIACHERQKAKGQQIGAVTPSAAPNTNLTAKAEGNWFKRMGRKLSGALTGAVSSALSTSTNTGNSFLPATAAAAAPPPPPAFTSLNDAKLDPRYRIGTGREDLFSGNYHWSTPLISLPGRNGLDLNLSLHYNSLQWVRYGNTMYYDPDWFITLPTGLTTGFNLGFPEIENGYTYDGVTSYVVTLPSGYRVPMRQVYLSGSTAKYEAADGSYMYLVLQGTNAPVLYLPDGTQYVYGATSAITLGKRCSLVRDSNGNRINIVYGSNGSISTITDTLGRVLNFVYETTYGHLMQITQNWLGQTHVLAQFDYALQPFSYNFSAISNVAVNAPANNSQISVLTRVITNDGARHAFVYGGWGLVEDVFLYGALDNQRAAADYVFPPTSTALSDAPRFSQRNDGIYGFAGQWNTNLGWVANYFLFDANETWGKVRTPDGVVHVEQFNASGNQRGLSTGKETWTGTTDWQGGVRQRWSTTTWASAGTNYPVYPRATETNVYDNTDTDPDPENRRRTTMEYWQFTAAGTMPYTVYLPKVTKEYAADAATVYRSTETDYLNNTNYWSRWIVGLPIQQRLKDGANALQSQTSYGYDEAPADTHLSSILQHDTSSYGASFYTRGNCTSTRRHDITNTAVYTQTFAEYYVTGNVARAYDPLNHMTQFYYDDAFATYADDAGNTETIKTLTTKTWAYPTRVQDPDSFSSYVKYWYDTGAPTRTTDPKGAIAFRMYETTYGRLAKTKSEFNSAYTRYVYDTGHNWVQTWSTINILSEETAVLSLLDGAGRERQHVDEHPGSVGTLSSWYRVYDLMGRVIQQSNPTEISSATWLPTGDDSAWVYSAQTYDWNHRPLVTTNQDTTTRQISYEGCGCAGNQTETITDEGTVITVNGQPQTKKRQQKVFYDAFGRVQKTQVLNWENGTPYSTSVNTYDVLDRLLYQRDFKQGTTPTQDAETTCTSSTNCQRTKIVYDSYGRLKERWLPSYCTAPSAGSTACTETTPYVNYEYNSDDTLYRLTDPRGVKATYAYNSRHLVTSITYDALANAVLPSPLPSRPIPSPNVTFGYDAAGNRTSMDDAPGSVSYTYDTLSQLTAETRTFDQGGVTRSFQLQYQYNLVGQLKQLTDPWSATVTYNRDKTGRETGLTATGYKDQNQWTNRNVTTFASNIRYRAWNGIKDFANGSPIGNGNFAMGYDSQMRLTSFTGAGRTTEHDYYNDGRVKEVRDLFYGSNFLRKYEYDQSARLTKAHAGGTAQTSTSPYSLTYGYDEWGNTTSRTGSNWSQSLASFNTTYTNGHDNNMKYDAAGNVKNYASASSNDPYTHYNAGNQLFTQFVGGSGGLVKVREQYFDGDGGKVLYATFDGSTSNGSYTHVGNYYYIRSSILGGAVVGEYNDLFGYSVTDSMSYVYLQGERLAFQRGAHQSTGDKYVVWEYKNPVVGSYLAQYQLNNSSSQPVTYPYGEMLTDPLGAYLGTAQSQPINVPEPFTFVMGQSIDQMGKCYADYVETPCTVVQKWRNSGVGQDAPLEQYSTMRNPTTGQNELTRFTVDWDNGFSGFVPLGATYGGDGTWRWNRPKTDRPSVKPQGTYKGGIHESLHGNNPIPLTEDDEPEPDGRLKPLINKIINFLSLLNDRSYALGPNLNLLPSIIDDAIINEVAKRIYDPNCYSVVAHGNPSSMWDKSKRHIFPKQLADMIRKDSSYNPSNPVKLYSCNTGVNPSGGGRSFGENLARELGTEVIAPTGYVCFGALY